ncbi:hypothetical protein DPMN_070699 [Dreissena polymorpha]|uniref:Secreted protein n=1 Tax=Dreissena polymorpha TaxID=45954 RepID=A0A9D4BVV0_DREPO|nr:hypothetical protein DPMN_070699 [Dreissena polymorpha]
MVPLVTFVTLLSFGWTMVTRRVPQFSHFRSRLDASDVGPRVLPFDVDPRFVEAPSVNLRYSVVCFAPDEPDK